MRISRRFSTSEILKPIICHGVPDVIMNFVVQSLEQDENPEYWFEFDFTIPRITINLWFHDIDSYNQPLNDLVGEFDYIVLQRKDTGDTYRFNEDKGIELSSMPHSSMFCEYLLDAVETLFGTAGHSITLTLKRGGDLTLEIDLDIEAFYALVESYLVKTSGGELAIDEVPAQFAEALSLLLLDPTPPE